MATRTKDEANVPFKATVEAFAKSRDKDATTAGKMLRGIIRAKDAPIRKNPILASWLREKERADGNRYPNMTPAQRDELLSLAGSRK